MSAKLIYQGNGDAFIGVPARNLSEEEFAARSAEWAELGITEELLIESGLYKKADEPKSEKKSKRGAIQDAEKEES